MTEYFDAEALLADCRRKRERADEVARRARAKLGVQTATRRDGELFYSDGRGALGWLYEDGEDPDLVVRDSAFIKQLLKIWKRRPRIAQGRSTIHLSSGREFVFDHKSGRVLRP
jgi:hypothetical protein